MELAGASVVAELGWVIRQHHSGFCLLLVWYVSKKAPHPDLLQRRHLFLDFRTFLSTNKHTPRVEPTPQKLPGETQIVRLPAAVLARCWRELRHTAISALTNPPARSHSRFESLSASSSQVCRCISVLIPICGILFFSFGTNTTLEANLREF